MGNGSYLGQGSQCLDKGIVPRLMSTWGKRKEGRDPRLFWHRGVELRDQDQPFGIGPCVLYVGRLQGLSRRG